MAQPWKSYREQSKANWGSEECQLTDDRIKIGCLLRIADALDKIAEPYTKQLTEIENLRRWRKEDEEEIKRLGCVIRSLRGTITRMKKK